MKKLLLFLLLGLAGCGFVFQNLGQGQDQGLKEGMPKEEVVNLIGQPQTVKHVMIKDQEYDVWEYADKPQIDQYRPLGVGVFKIFFLDDKLVQRGNDRVYGQPSYEYLESIDSTGVMKITNPPESPKDNSK